MKAGFVSILGEPNVGKSTLLNRLVGLKLAGVSRKPQTTRQVIRGILTESRGQIVFMDTPGLHKPKDALGRFMVRQAAGTLPDADIVYFMMEPSVSEAETALHALEPFRANPKPVFCLINKIDTVSKPEILPIMDWAKDHWPFRDIIPVSAKQGDQLELLLERTFEELPEHEPYFPADMTSDQTERFIAGEIIREKIFRFTGEEIPYAAVVEIEEFKEEEKLIRIHAVIYIEKESQKPIMIGSGGKKLKEIGIEARRGLEQFLGKQVFLKLWVKVLKDWKRDERALRRFGFQ